MKSQLTQSWAFHRTPLGFLIIVLLVIGIFFRFVNLDRKVYWVDETYTSLRISGYRQIDESKDVFDGHEVGIKDLQKYQRTSPEKGIIDTINSLALDDPQHPPLYYLMARFWVQCFGDSVAVTRSFSIITSLLAFPCIYWLCRELFESSLVGWVAMALIAVSPFHVLYAQQAREYSLWIFTILLSSAALLQAMRLKTNLSWGIYATTLALALYTYLFSLWLAIGQGIYVLTAESFRLSKTFVAYLLASLAGILAYGFWIWVVITNIAAIYAGTSSLEAKVPLLSLAKVWAFNLSRIFLDVEFDSTNAPMNISFGYNNPWTYLHPIIFLLIGYSIYFLCRNTPKKVWLFIVILIGFTALVVILPDLIKGGHRSSTSRYLIPSYLGIEIAVAYLLATQITSHVNFWQQKLWSVVTIIVVSSGILSCWMSSQAESWWSCYTEYYAPQVVRMINQAKRPLLIVETSPIFVFPLSHSLEPKVRFQLTDELHKLSKINEGFSDTLVYSVTPYAEKLLKDRLEKEPKYKAELVFDRKLSLALTSRQIRLWKLVKQ